MKHSQWIALGLFLLVTFAAAGVAAVATQSSVTTWYPTLNKPSWTPPSAVFAPVWLVLYIMMAIAGWRIWWHPMEASRGWAIRGYFLQLVLNAAWSVLFFGFRRPDLAMADIMALWIILLWLQVRYWRRDRVAGVLWAPYVVWVTFAMALNATITRLN